MSRIDRRGTRRTRPGAGDLGWAEEVTPIAWPSRAWRTKAGARAASNSPPGYPPRQYRQRMPQVDHLVQPGAEKSQVVMICPRFPQVSGTHYFNSKGFRQENFHRRRCSCGLWQFAGPTRY